MKNNLTLLCGACLVALALNACKKDNDTTSGADDLYPTVGVLQSNSGYETIWDTAAILNGSFDQFGMFDMTLEDGKLLNVAISTSDYPEVNYDLMRRSINVNTGKVVWQPSTEGLQYPMPNIAHDDIVYSFFPYTNIFGVFANRYGESIGFYGDISAGAPDITPGQGDFGFRYPVYNSGGFFGGYGFTSDGLAPAQGSNFIMRRAGVGTQANQYRFSALHEVYDDNGTLRYYAIGVRGDSVLVHEIEYTSLGGGTEYPTFTTNLVASLVTDFEGFYDIRTLRHYSTDGKKLAFMISDLLGGTYAWEYPRNTFVYDFETKTISEKLRQKALDYAGNGTDIDIDDEGNIYYTGTADFGNNENGVSIYKVTPDGEHHLVGKDNFLKYGTVVDLKVFDGKVYLAVSGKQTGKDVQQISLIREK